GRARSPGGRLPRRPEGSRRRRNPRPCGGHPRRPGLRARPRLAAGPGASRHLPAAGGHRRGYAAGGGYRRLPRPGAVARAQGDRVQRQQLPVPRDRRGIPCRGARSGCLSLRRRQRQRRASRLVGLQTVRRELLGQRGTVQVDAHDSADTRDRPKLMPGPTQTILVVEDEQAIASFVAAYLRKDGFAVQMTASGREALSLVGSQPPSLVILDLMLPDLDGMEVCRRIRETSTLPVLM